MLYLYRGISQLNGSTFSAWFYVDGKKVASLESKQYVALSVTPKNIKQRCSGDNLELDDPSITKDMVVGSMGSAAICHPRC